MSAFTFLKLDSAPLSVVDPEIYDLIEKEKQRQCNSINLIASENFISSAALEALGSVLTNKYMEVRSSNPDYIGNKVVREVEALCISRALKLYELDEAEWGVNVQPYSGSPANFAVYTALLEPGDVIMGLDLPSGGHLTHGYSTSGVTNVSATSTLFNCKPYKVDPETGYIDYEQLEKDTKKFRPKLIICGGSAYLRDWDYARFRTIADGCNAVLLCDMAHISGLVATLGAKNPFGHCDVVTTTTHKSIRGPRSGMIFFRRGRKHSKHSDDLEGDDTYEFEGKIAASVFPSLQGGAHHNQIASLAVALNQAMLDEFIFYIDQVKENAATLGNYLTKKKYKMMTCGTDNHLLLWDLRSLDLTGDKLEMLCDMCNITLNKNAVFGDHSVLAPGGVRIGSLAMTSRGLVKEDFEKIGDFLDQAVKLCLKVQKEVQSKSLTDFKKGLINNPEIKNLKAAVQEFSSSFDMPSFQKSEMKYRD